MLIREFLCVHEHGTVIYHKSYPLEDHKTELLMLRSGLISALYNFANEVEEDTLESLNMQKIKLIFKKSLQLIFIIFVDTRIDSSWCQDEIDLLIERFFKQFPEFKFQSNIIEISQFEAFNDTLDEVVDSLNKKLEFITLLIDEELITEEEFKELDLSSLGSLVGSRIVQKNQSLLAYALNEGNEIFIDQILDILEQLKGDHIVIEGRDVKIDCNKCFLCPLGTYDCFYETLLQVLIEPLDYTINTIH